MVLDGTNASKFQLLKSVEAGVLCTLRDSNIDEIDSASNRKLISNSDQNFWKQCDLGHTMQTAVSNHPPHYSY